MPVAELGGAGADEETIRCSRCPQCNRTWQLPEPQSGYCSNCNCAVEVVAEDSEATWERREAARRRQIEIGKARPEYKRYLEKVPKEFRDEDQPSTPNPRDRVSKRQFDRALGEWRRRLHEWDAEFGWGPEGHEASQRQLSSESFQQSQSAASGQHGLAQPAGLVTQSNRRRNRGNARGVGNGGEQIALPREQPATPLPGQPLSPQRSQQLPPQQPPQLHQQSQQHQQSQLPRHLATPTMSIAPPLTAPQLPPPQLPPPTQPPHAQPAAAPQQPPAGDPGIVQLRLAEQLGDTSMQHHFPPMVPDFSDYGEHLQQAAAATLLAGAWPCWGMPPPDPDLLQAFLGQHQAPMQPDPETPMRSHRTGIFEDGETPPPLEMQVERSVLGAVREEETPLEKCRLTFESFDCQDSGYPSGRASMRRSSPVARINSVNPPCTPPRNRGMAGSSMRSPPSSVAKTPTTGWVSDTPSPQRLHFAAVMQHQMQQQMQQQLLIPPAQYPWPSSSF